MREDPGTREACCVPCSESLGQVPLGPKSGREEDVYLPVWDSLQRDTPSVSMVWAYKELPQIVAALMTEVGKNTGKSVKTLYGNKVWGKLNRVVFGDCAWKEQWIRSQGSRKDFY